MTQVVLVELDGGMEGQRDGGEAGFFYEKQLSERGRPSEHWSGQTTAH